MPLKWSCGSTVFALYHPSKDPNVDKLTSVSYEGWFFGLFICFFHLPPVSLPPHFTFIHSHCLETCLSVEAWLNTIWMTLLERPLTQFFRPHWRVGERHVGSVKKVLIFCFVFFTAPLYLQNIETICRTQCVKLNLSGHLLRGIIYCRWCWDPDLGCLSTYNHHWLSRRAVSEMDKKRKEKVKKTVIIVEIWICLKTLSKMLFVVLFYSSFIAEPRPTFGPKEQYISGVCNYMLLTMCQVYHCMTIRFFLFFVVGLFFCFFSQDVSGTDFCGLLVTLRICYMVRRRAVLAD